MKRTPLKRKTWLNRGTKGLARTGGPKRGKGVNPVNRERRAKLREKQFGRHADFIRSLACVAQGSYCKGRIEVAHVKSRGAGGTAKDTVPMCWAHHKLQHWLGRDTFERMQGLDLAAIAAELWQRSPESRGERE